MTTIERKHKIVSQTSSRIAQSKSFSHFNLAVKVVSLSCLDSLPYSYEIRHLQSCLIVIMLSRGRENNIMLHLQ